VLLRVHRSLEAGERIDSPRAFVATPQPGGYRRRVWALEISGGEIVGMSSIVNPDKLRHLGPVADTRALPRLVARSRGSSEA
jgi:hypothetical protein